MDTLSTKTSPNDLPEAEAADPVKDVDLSTFMADVIEASRYKLVIVDFWAPWCGPCKQLGPVLEKLVRAQKGAVLLAQIDIDRNPEIAQQMRVQSIPAVFAFFQGQPVDGFMGALPESQIKAWVEKLLKAIAGVLPKDAADGLKTALKQAEDFLAQGDAATAHAIYADILTEHSEHVLATAGLMRCLLAQGETEKARVMLAALSPDRTKDKAFDSIRTALDLAEQAQKTAGSQTELLKRVQENPNDHQARFDLSLALYAAGQKEEAVEALLEIVQRDRAWNDAAARKQLVKLFETFGPTDTLTISARKRLSSILFS